MNHKPASTLIWTILVVFWAITAHGAGPFAGGTGEPNDPFQIETAQQLLTMGKDPNLLDKHFILNNDIDMDPNGQIVINSVIGLYESPFFGEFDGNYYVISNLTIQCENDAGCGFTGILKGVVCNLTLENVLISQAARSGAISGDNEGTIKNCHAFGRITGTERLGGLVGYNSGLLSRSTANVMVTGTSREIGGLVGRNSQTIFNCSSRGNVRGSLAVGGLVGEDGGSIIESHSDCNTVGDENVGGLVGREFGGKLILKCQTQGSVHGKNNVGGFVGLLLDIFGNPYLSKNASSSSVHADQVAGGLIGSLNLDTGMISECYALGEVKANTAGGFIGSALFSSYPSRSYSLTDCYAANRISGINEPLNLQDADESTFGGFIGQLQASEKSALERLQYLSSCFWDIDKTGQSEGIRLSNPPSWPLDTSQTGVQGKTTAQMMDPNTFIRSGWDYDTLWTQTSGQDYPRLKCLSTGFSSKEADDE